MSSAASSCSNSGEPGSNTSTTSELSLMKYGHSETAEGSQNQVPREPRESTLTCCRDLIKSYSFRMRSWSPTVSSVDRAFSSPPRLSSLYILTVLYLIRTFSGMSEHIHMVSTSIHTSVLPFLLGVLSFLGSPLRQLHCYFLVSYTNMILLICVKSRNHVWEKTQHGTEPDLIHLISSCICFLQMAMLSLRLRKSQCSITIPPDRHLTFNGLRVHFRKGGSDGEPEPSTSVFSGQGRRLHLNFLGPCWTFPWP